MVARVSHRAGWDGSFVGLGGGDVPKALQKATRCGIVAN